MEDQPSTSKDPSKRNELDDDKDEESRDEQGTNSGTTLSNGSGGLHMAAIGVEKPKPGSGNPDVKFDDKKRRKRRIGRVEKQRKPLTRRQVIRRAPKRKPRAKCDKKRGLSVSTIYSTLSSSGLLTPACERCGHRCCRRRYEFELRRKRKGRKNHHNGRRMCRSTVYISESIQAGSCCKMLSPLFINTNSAPFEEQPAAMTYSEITPAMIYESLRRLTMWKENVEDTEILKYIQRNYPVNPDPDVLFTELLEKLSIAVIVGIVTQTSNNTWCLSCALERRKLNNTHVTLFWKMYGDTLRPIAKKQNGESHNENSTADQEKTLRIIDYGIL